MAFPTNIPVTTPEADPTVAIELSLLLQLPPDEASLNVVVEPTHVEGVPVIGSNGPTVMPYVT